ncbi:MAG: hypothetical protein NC218_08530 [Acetobacter sp.]|nr:hypothetical protein [Acetobacter sp.]
MFDKEILLGQLQEYYNQIERIRNQKDRGSKARRNYNDVLKNLSDSMEIIELMEM